MKKLSLMGTIVCIVFASCLSVPYVQKRADNLRVLEMTEDADYLLANHADSSKKEIDITTTSIHLAEEINILLDERMDGKIEKLSDVKLGQMVEKTIDQREVRMLLQVITTEQTDLPFFDDLHMLEQMEIFRRILRILNAYKLELRPKYLTTKALTILDGEMKRKGVYNNLAEILKSILEQVNSLNKETHSNTYDLYDILVQYHTKTISPLERGLAYRLTLSKFENDFEDKKALAEKEF